MADITIKLPDGSERPVAPGTTAGELASSIGRRLGEAAVIAEVNGVERDLIWPLEDGDEVAIVTADSTGVKRLRDLMEIIKQKQPDSVMVLGMKDPETGKASILVAVGPAAPKNYNANDILKELSPLIEGKGGGKQDMAQAGGTKAEGLQPALAAAEKLLGAT